jgi:hypothetical protein
MATMPRFFALALSLWFQISWSAGITATDPYRDQVFASSIAGVRMQTESDPFASPVWELGSSNPPLVLHFDDLDGGYRPFTVRLGACRRDWTPADLFESQVFEGLDREPIQDHRPSFNT